MPEEESGTSEAVSVLSLDPGREKVGMALLSRSGDILERKIFLRSEFQETAKEILSRRCPDYIVIGDGTGCCHLAGELRSLIGETGEIDDCQIKIVDEKDTSTEAAGLYFKTQAGAGRRLLSRFISWRPREPVDDYAAAVLGRRFLEDKKEAENELKEQ